MKDWTGLISIGFAGGALLILFLIISCSLGFYLDLSGKAHEWLTAIGTVGAVIVAVWPQLERPKVKFITESKAIGIAARMFGERHGPKHDTLYLSVYYQSNRSAPLYINKIQISNSSKTENVIYQEVLSDSQNILSSPPVKVINLSESLRTQDIPFPILVQPNMCSTRIAISYEQYIKHLVSDKYTELKITIVDVFGNTYHHTMAKIISENFSIQIPKGI